MSSFTTLKCLCVFLFLLTNVSAQAYSGDPAVDPKFSFMYRGESDICPEGFGMIAVEKNVLLAPAECLYREDGLALKVTVATDFLGKSVHGTKSVFWEVTSDYVKSEAAVRELLPRLPGMTAAEKNAPDVGPKVHAWMRYSMGAVVTEKPLPYQPVRTILNLAYLHELRTNPQLDPAGIVKARIRIDTRVIPYTYDGWTELNAEANMIDAFILRHWHTSPLAGGFGISQCGSVKEASALPSCGNTGQLRYGKVSVTHAMQTLRSSPRYMLFGFNGKDGGGSGYGDRGGFLAATEKDGSLVLIGMLNDELAGWHTASSLLYNCAFLKQFATSLACP